MSYGIGTAWGGANEDWIFIFNWTSALTHTLTVRGELWKDDDFQLSLSGKDGKDKHSFISPQFGTLHLQCRLLLLQTSGAELWR